MPCDGYRYDPTRYLVLTDRLTIYSGVYELGEMITEAQVGTARERLVAAGMLAEADYDLCSLSVRPEML